MAKGNRQRAVLFKRAKVQARAFVELENDKNHSASTPAINKRDCIAAYERHKAGVTGRQAPRIIGLHW